MMKRELQMLLSSDVTSIFYGVRYFLGAGRFDRVLLGAGLMKKS